MANYSIIRSLQSLCAFVDWLPDLEDNERFYVCLHTRKKYGAKRSTELTRFVSRREELIDKIRRLECPVGSFTLKSGEGVPDGSLVLYMAPNPRDLRKATFAATKAFVDLIDRGNFNPHQEVLSCIHKAKSRSVFVHFDIDWDDLEDNPDAPCSCAVVKDVVSELVGDDAIAIIETKGGCHLMIDPDAVVSDRKDWYSAVVDSISCDRSGDLLVPVVGCCQGHFSPRFYG